MHPMSMLVTSYLYDIESSRLGTGIPLANTPASDIHTPAQGNVNIGRSFFSSNYLPIVGSLARGGERGSMYYVLLISCGDIIKSDDIQGWENLSTDDILLSA